MDPSHSSERLVIEAAAEVRADELQRYGEPARWAAVQGGRRVVGLGEKPMQEALDRQAGNRIVRGQLARNSARDTRRGSALSAWPRPPAWLELSEQSDPGSAERDADQLRALRADLVRVGFARRMEQEVAGARFTDCGTDALVERATQDETKVRCRVRVEREPRGKAVQRLGDNEIGDDLMVARLPQVATWAKPERHAFHHHSSREPGAIHA
jgi:hypothetical protein